MIESTEGCEVIGSRRRDKAAPQARLDPCELDGGPPLDPSSPFLEPAAEARRRAARDGRSGRRLLRAVLAWLTALAIVGAAIYGGFWFTGYRLAVEGKLELGPSVLTATTVGVPTPGTGQVARVRVVPGDEVAASEPVFDVRIFSDGALRSGKSSISVRAPIDGVVTSILRPTGSALSAGDPVVEMYDPASRRFETPIDPAVLDRLRIGMRAELTAPGVSEPIAATVQQVVPAPPPSAAQDPAAASTTEEGSGALTLVLEPVDSTSVGDLIPGIRFRTVVDLRSVSSDAPSLFEPDSP